MFETILSNMPNKSKPRRLASKEQAWHRPSWRISACLQDHGLLIQPSRSSQHYTLASHLLREGEATLLKVFKMKYDQMEKIDIFNL